VQDVGAVNIAVDADGFHTLEQRCYVIEQGRHRRLVGSAHCSGQHTGIQNVAQVKCAGLARADRNPIARRVDAAHCVDAGQQAPQLQPLCRRPPHRGKTA